MEKVESAASPAGTPSSASAPNPASVPSSTSAPDSVSVPNPASVPNPVSVSSSVSAPSSASMPSPASTSSPVSPGLAGGISIGHLPVKKVETPKLQSEVKPLTQEDLDRYWKETATQLNLQLLMEKGKPRLGELGRIEIDALSTYFHEEFKPHRIDVMEVLRQKSGMPMLECKVNPLYIEKDEVIYSPQDKYKAMLQINPNLVELRKLFPQIDY